MSSEAFECFDHHRGSELEYLTGTVDLNQVLDRYAGEPGSFRPVREHFLGCAVCSRAYPDAMARIDLVQQELNNRAVQQIENAQAEFAAEFSEPKSGEENWHYADRIAAMASTYSPRLNWQLSFFTGEWTDFSVLPRLPQSGKTTPISACREHIRNLPSKSLRFLFTVLLTGDLYSMLYGKFWHMSLPFLLQAEAGSGRIRPLDNPDYPKYQAYELRASATMNNSGKDDEDEPIYGSAILLNFIRENMREALPNTPLDYCAFYAAIEEAATGYLQHFEDDLRGANGEMPGLDPIATPAPQAVSRKLDEVHTDLTDGLDSLRAGQMHLRLLIERNRRSADDFLPIIESRLGNVYSRLQTTTRRLLARGEYFWSLNQAEPDAMNVVVLHQAKACEHELYMRIFGPYIVQLLQNGVRDYLNDSKCMKLLLKNQKEQAKNMSLSTYCWYLKHDSLLKSWIESTLKIPVQALIDESYWISDQRNLAAHEADFKQFDAAIFQQRIFSSTGLLACLAALGVRSGEKDYELCADEF